MKQCPNCGAQIADNSSACPECGMPISKNNVCPHCGADVNEGDVFCKSCGKRLVEDSESTVFESGIKICPHCGANVKEEDAFCKNCGQDLRGGSFAAYPNGSPNNPYGGEKGNSSGKYLLFIFGVLFLAAVCGGGWYGYKKITEVISEKQKREHIADSLEKVSHDSVNKIDEVAVTDTTAADSVAEAIDDYMGDDYSVEGYQHLNGSISEYGITMDINIDENSVEGTYYYHSQGSSKKMTLSGYIEGSDVYLEEYDPEGSNTGFFSGTFDGRTYEGTFTNYQKGEGLPFYLTTN